MAAPTISAIANRTVDVGTSTEVNFTVTGGVGAVTLTRATSDPSILPLANVTPSLTGTNGKLTIVAGNPTSFLTTIFSDITVTAQDNNGSSNQTFRVTINRAPLLTGVSNFTATEDTARTISYNQLTSAANDSDPDNNDIEFELVAISAGTMNVSAGAKLTNSSGSWTWNPPLNDNGVIEAFTVKAYDGRIYSATAVPVSIDVAPVNNDPPVIAGAVLGLTQGTAISDKVTTSIFSGLTVTDPDHNKPNNDLLRVTVSIPQNYFQSQFIVENGWTGTSTNLTYGPATPSQITGRLQALKFVPSSNMTPVGTKQSFNFVLEIEDVSYPGTSNEPTITDDVFVESVNDEPSLTVSFAPTTIPDVGTAKPFRLFISDPDINENFTVTLTELTSFGTLNPLPVTITGDQNTVQNYIRDQVGYQPNPIGLSQSAQFRYSVTDIHPSGTSGTPTIKEGFLTIAGVNDPPEISGITVDLIRTTDDPQAPPVFPFSTIRISDPDNGQLVTVVLSLDDPAKGEFYFTGTPVNASPVTTKTATVSDLTAWLRLLKYVPSPNRVPEGEVETATVTVRVTDPGVPPLSTYNSLTLIAVTSVNGAPLLKWNNTLSFPALTNPESIALPPNSKPFDKVVVEDDGLVTVSVSLDVITKGSLSALNGFVETPLGSRIYKFTGDPATATTKLRALVFDPNPAYQFPPNAPGRTNFTIDVTDAASNRSIRVVPIVLQNLSRNWLVTSTLDQATTVGTLRHAIANAGQNDVITFALASYPAVIRLSQANGPLLVTKHLSIKGPGADQLTITGDSNSNGQTDALDTQIFRIFASVRVDSLTLARGYATTGGAFLVGYDPNVPVDSTNQPGSLNLVNCVIADCKAEEWGGAIDVIEGSLKVVGSLFLRNAVSESAGLGGGAVSLYTSESCSFENTTFSANRQPAPAGSGGGALYVENFEPSVLFEIDVTHCTFSENVDASVQGTSICSNVFNSYVNIANSIFADSVVGFTNSRNLFVTGDGSIVSMGGNISTDLTTTTFNQGGIRLLNHATDLTGVNPQLQPLGIGIGSVAGYHLGLSSPALNLGLPVLAADQRGVMRDATPDAGAIEKVSTSRVLINEIFAPAVGDSFIEFYVPRDSVAVNFQGLELWVDGTLRHIFPSSIVQSGHGLILSDSATALSASLQQAPSENDLELTPRGTIELRTATQKVYLAVSYVNVFVNPNSLLGDLAFTPENSLSLVPQFSGAALIPSSLAKGPPLQGVEIATLSNAIPITGPNNATSPGKDNSNTAFGQPNALPLAVADSYLIGEDSFTNFDVLNNDVDADGLDLLRIIDVSQNASGIPPVGSDATALSTLGASVNILPGGTPLRGTSVDFDPRDAHNHLPAGAQAFDTFRYTIVDIGAGDVVSYALSGAVTKIVSLGHRLINNEQIRISGSSEVTYNGNFAVTVLDVDSFTIPISYAGNPPVGSRGVWQTVGTRLPTEPSEKLVSVTILGANDAPTPTPNSVTTPEDTVLRIFGDGDFAGNAPALDTDVSYPLPRLASSVPLLVDDSDPDDDDNPGVTGSLTRLKLVGVGQAYSILNYAGTVGASPVTVSAPNHGLSSGSTILISGYGGHPSYNGHHVVTVVDASTLTIPVQYVDNAASKGLWGILTNENRLATTSVEGAAVTLEIRANRAQTNIVYNPRTSVSLNKLSQGEPGVDSFYYVVEDSHAALAFAKVTVNVIGVNDAPVPGNDPPGLADILGLDGVTDLGAAMGSGTVLYQIPSAGGGGKKDVGFAINGTTVVIQDLCATNEDAALQVPFTLLLENDSDVDVNSVPPDNVLQVQLAPGQFASREGAIVSLVGSNLVYDPRVAPKLQALAREETVIDTLNITIHDGVVGVVSTLAIVVTGTNDTPVASPDAATIPEDQLLTLSPPGVLLNDLDRDQNTSLPDNKKLLLPVTDAPTNAFGTSVNAGIGTISNLISQFGVVTGDPLRTTVTSVNHGLQSGEEVIIFDSTFVAANGQFPIVRVDADSFTIPVPHGPAASGTVGQWYSVQSTLTYDPRGSIFTFTGLDHTPPFTLDGLAQGQTFTDTYLYTMLDGSMVFANDDLFRIEVDRELIELKVLSNDVNLVGLGGGLRIISVGTPNRGGTVTINESASLIYSPETGFVGDEVFTYTVEDELGNRDSALVTARTTIMQLNGNLQANADDFTAALGQTSILNVLANDDLIPAGTATLTVTRVSTPPNHGGTAVVEGNQIRYTPSGGGAPYVETFSYEISAGGSAVAQAQATVAVVDRTNTLTLRNDAFSVPTGSNNNVLNVLINDNVLPGTGAALTVTQFTAPAQGTVTIAEGGLGLLYSPAPQFTGNVQFTYTASDGVGGTNTAQVVVQVGYLTTNPDFFSVLFDDPGKTTDDGTKILPVLANDTVLQGPSTALTIVSVSPANPTLGSMIVTPGGGSLTFDPAVSQTGQQLFTYTIQDATGHQATGSVTVVVAQQGLLANADSFTVQTGSSANELLVLANDVIFNSTGGSSMSVSSIGTGPDAPDQGGTVTISPTADRLIYTPASGFVGVETFTYAVTDGLVTTTSRVTVRSSTGELAAGADFFTVFRGSQQNTLTVLLNDLVIPDGGQLLTITALTNDPANLSNPANRGLLAIKPDLRTLEYTPNELNTAYPYTETFTYEISDGTARRDQAVLTIQVLDRIGARDIDTNNDIFTIRTNSAETILNVLANDNIRPATAVGWEITSVSAPTSNVCSPFVTADLLDVAALTQKLVVHSDPLSLFLWSSFSPSSQALLSNVGSPIEARAAVLVQELNILAFGPSIHSPARFTGVTLRQGTQELLDVNPAGEQLVVLNRLLLEDGFISELRQSPDAGAVVSNGNFLLYTPPTGLTGTVRFTYRVSDGLGGTGSGEVVVRVGDISVSDDYFVVLSESMNNDLDVLSNDGILRDAFPDSPAPAAADFVLVANPNVIVDPVLAGTAVITGGKVRFTPTAGFVGLATLTYWVADDSGCLFSGKAQVDVQKRGSDRSASTLTITVTGVNDLPVFLGGVSTAMNDKQTSTPFSGVIIRDVDNQLSEIIVVRISFPSERGTLNGAFNLIGPGLYEFVGTGGQATAAIRSLVYVPVENRINVDLTEETTFTISLQDPFSPSPVINSTPKVQVTSVNDAPVLTGTVASQRVYMLSTIDPFAGVNITDVDNLTLQSLSVSIVIDNPIKGNLSNLSSFVEQPVGTYTITGTPEFVSASIRGLVFTPTPGTRVTPGNPETATFTITVNDGFAPAVVDAITSVIVQHPFAAKLLPLNPTTNVDSSQTNAQFATSVDLSGDTIIVGSGMRDGVFSDSGVAFVYERNVGGVNRWGQVARLLPTDLAAGDLFGGGGPPPGGGSVAIDGDTIAVGAPSQDASGLVDSGSVYIFKRNALDRNVWDQVTKIVAPLGERGASDQFGKAVALQGTTLIVGAPYANKPAADSGVVYVFDQNDGGPDAWGFQQKLTPTSSSIDGAAGDRFGFSVAIDVNTLVVGANGANRTVNAADVDYGAAYVFTRPNATGPWTAEKKLQIFTEAGASSEDLFGFDVDVSENSILVGVPQFDSPGQIHTGAAFVFNRDLGGSGNWGLSKKFLNESPVEGDLFGRSVSLVGDLALVGAPKQLVPPVGVVSFSGFTNVYRRSPSRAETWSLLESFKPSPINQIDQFGVACALDQFTAVVGSSGDALNLGNVGSAGAAFVYDFKFNNDPRFVMNIADQIAQENTAFSFTVPEQSFMDPDYSDTLTYSVKTVSGTPIPPTSWLQFNPASATFSGTPTPTNYHPVDLIVTATDVQGATIESNAFRISVDVDAARAFGLLVEEWQKGYFSTTNLQNPAMETNLWGNDANPDGDAYPNLIEMAMGTNPNIPDAPNLLGVEANPPFLTLLYQLDNDFPTEFVNAEWSLNLTTWTQLNIAESVRTELSGGRVIAATAYPPAPSGRVYIRLRVGAP